MFRTSADGVEMVFSLLDLLIVVLVMIVTVIWFRSKYLERFYEACKVRTSHCSTPSDILFVGVRQERWRLWRSTWRRSRAGSLSCPARRSVSASCGPPARTWTRSVHQERAVDSSLVLDCEETDDL